MPCSKRKEFNQKILEVLEELLDEHPELRFNQALKALGIDSSKFYQESEDTYQELKKIN